MSSFDVFTCQLVQFARIPRSCSCLTFSCCFALVLVSPRCAPRPLFPHCLENSLPSIIGWKLHVFWCRCNVSTRFPQSWISIVGFLYVTSRVQASHCPACFVIDASQSPIVKDPFPNLARQEDPDTSTSLQLSRRCNKHAGLYRLACSCTPSATYIIGWFQFVAILEALHADSSWAMRIVGKRSLEKTMQLSFICVQCLCLQP